MEQPNLSPMQAAFRRNGKPHAHVAFLKGVVEAARAAARPDLRDLVDAMGQPNGER